jgi:D-alanyl-D-alanine dipeptidase
MAIDFSVNFFRSLQIPNRDYWRIKKSICFINGSDWKFDEPLVEIRDLNIDGENHYWVMKNPPVKDCIPHLLVRQSLAEILKNIENMLHEHGLGLFVKDAWRPVSLQKNRYEYYQKWLKERNPEWSEEMIQIRMTEWFHPVREEELLIHPPPHTTGGAVDLTLKDLSTGKLLPMGNGYDFKQTDYFELESERRLLSQDEIEILNNRRILYWSMFYNGLINTQSEWWHYSWGDQSWGRFHNRTAYYGYINNI